MKIVGGLWAVMVFYLLAVVGFFWLAHKRGWMHWERCHRAALGLSGLGKTTWHRALFIYRVIIGLYILSILIFVLSVGGGKSFYFYTVWNYIALSVYFICAIFQSARANFAGFSLSSQPSQAILDRVTFVLYELCFTTVIMVDVVLWGVLYTHAKHAAEHPDPDDPNVTCCHQFINFGSINVHGVNFFLLVGDFVMNNQRMVPAHVVYVVCWELLFGLYSWVVHAAGGPWVYFFLNTSEKSAPLWYLGMGALHVLFFFIAFGFSKLRDRFWRHVDEEEEREREAQYLLSVNDNVA